MRAWHVLVAALLVCAVLGYRVVVLEGQVERLSRRLGEPMGGGEGGSEATPVPEFAAADAEHDQRLDDIEADVQELRADVDALADETRGKADLEDVDRSASPDKILGVVTSEVERIRDRQLEFHRDRWLEARERAAEDFSTRYGLDERQAEEIRRLLLVEVDDMIKILKSPDAVEDPNQALSDWIAMLEETDRTAKRVLSPSQIEPWDQARSFERKLLMPWLPQEE